MKLIESLISYFLPSVITQSQISQAVSDAFKETFKEMGYLIAEHHHKKEQDVVDENCIGYEQFVALEKKVKAFECVYRFFEPASNY